MNYYSPSALHLSFTFDQNYTYLLDSTNFFIFLGAPIQTMGLGQTGGHVLGHGHLFFTVLQDIDRPEYE